MLHVNEFNSDKEVTAAYTAESFWCEPEDIIGVSGNAVLAAIDGGLAVISQPRLEGEILETLGIVNRDFPTVDLSWAF